MNKILRFAENSPGKGGGQCIAADIASAQVVGHLYRIGVAVQTPITFSSVFGAGQEVADVSWPAPRKTN